MKTYASIVFIVSMGVLGCSELGNQFVQEPEPPPTSTEPHVEIIMDCPDRVSIGGTLRVVINSEAAYQQLIYDRFTRPLEEYWNANYDSTLAHIRRRYPGLSEEEYQRLVREAFYSVYPFKGTNSCTIPTIDFGTRTLLGQDAQTTGCTLPDYETSVIRNDSTQTATYKVRITQHGRCEIAWNMNKWILTGKIPANYSVQFEKEYILN